MSKQTIDWTDENTQRLRAMKAKGWSISEIGAALGCSRSAVAGKIKRLGLSDVKRTPIKPLAAWKRAKAISMLSAGMSIEKTAQALRIGVRTASRINASRPKVKVAPPPVVDEPDLTDDIDDTSPAAPPRLSFATGPGDGTGMADLRHGQCAWPLWGNKDRPTFRCCGAPVARGSYCQTHATKAYGKRHAGPSKPWTQDDLDRCTGLYLAGMPVPKIAPLIGRSSTEIAEEMRARGIKFGSGQRLVGGTAA